MFSGAVEVDVAESDHERQAIVALAGLAAVEMFDGPVDRMTEDQDTDDCDMPTARRYAAALARPDGDADAVLSTLRKRTDELLGLPGTESVLRAIADQAVRFRGLDGDAIRRLMAGADSSAVVHSRTEIEANRNIRT